MSRARVLATAVTLACASPIYARAATLRVPSQFATIQAGIDAAVAQDTVLVAPGVYSDYQTRNVGGFLTAACVFLKNDVRVVSEGGSGVTALGLEDLQGPTPQAVLAYNLPGTATLFEGFSLNAVGRGLACYAVNCGMVTFRGCRFEDFDGGTTAGGALLSNSNVTVIDCEFDNCRANTGGAIWHSRHHIVIDGCTFKNAANVAVFIDEATISAPVLATVTNCQFIDNWSNVGGCGGLTIGTARGGQSRVEGCLFLRNKNYGVGGGALQVGPGAKLVEDTVFIENGALGPNGTGGAIYGSTGIGSFEIRNNTFFGNYKNDNGGAGGAFDIGYCTFQNNVVSGTRFGAVFGENTVLISDCNVFWDNDVPVGIPLSPTDRIVDPLFCDPEVFDLTLRIGSPCLPADALGCGLIGAYEQGCGSVSVDAKSWGAIKGMYR